MSRASMKALPTIPNMLSTPCATIVSVNASLEVILVGLVLHAGSSGLGVEVEKRVVQALYAPVRFLEREKRGRVLPTTVAILEIWWERGLSWLYNLWGLVLPLRSETTPIPSAAR